MKKTVRNASRIFSAFIFVVSLPITFFILSAALLAQFQQGSFYIVFSMFCLIAWSVISFLRPQYVPAIILPFFLIIHSVHRSSQINQNQVKDLCERLKNDIRCRQNQHGFTCNKESTFNGGNFSIRDCTRPEELENASAAYFREYDSKMEKEKARKERERRLELKNIAAAMSNPDSYNRYEIEEKNTYQFQEVIFENFPNKILNLEEEITLHPGLIAILSDNVYKFESFLPSKHQNQPEVVTKAQQQEENRVQNLNRFKEYAQYRLSKDTSYPLIHKDLFNDPNFVKGYLEKCIRNFGSIQVSVLTIFKRKGVFSEKELKNFIKMHPEGNFSFNCYPKDLIDNPRLLEELSLKLEDTHFLTAASQINDSSHLKELARKQEFHLAQVGIQSNLKYIQEISPQLLNSEDFQKWIFNEYPSAVKFADNIQFNQKIVTEFIKNTYNPEWFFSNQQKRDSKIGNLLKLHPNKSKKHIENSREQAISKIKHFDCCSNNFETHLNQYLLNLPAEVINDSAFHLHNLKNVKQDRTYIQMLAEKKLISKEIKIFMIQECAKNLEYQHIFNLGGHEPAYVKEDPSFRAALKDSCSKIKKSRN